MLVFWNHQLCNVLLTVTKCSHFEVLSCQEYVNILWQEDTRCLYWLSTKKSGLSGKYILSIINIKGNHTHTHNILLSPDEKTQSGVRLSQNSAEKHVTNFTQNLRYAPAGYATHELTFPPADNFLLSIPYVTILTVLLVPKTCINQIYILSSETRGPQQKMTCWVAEQRICDTTNVTPPDMRLYLLHHLRSSSRIRVLLLEGNQYR